MLRTPLLLVVYSTLSATCLANPTVSILPESSDVYPANTSFSGLTSSTNDPLAPFSGSSVHFVGHQQSGGSSETLGNVFLVYRARLEFDSNVILNEVSVTGAGDQTGDSVLRILDENMAVIATTPLTGFNTLGTHTVSTGGIVGSVFFLDEFDDSTDFRYRSLISADFDVIPEPSTLVLLIVGSLLSAARLKR